MIKDLSIYSQWKKTTLDRLTDKYRREFMKVFETHLKKHRHVIESAIKEKSNSFLMGTEGLEDQLVKVLDRHQEHTVKTAVSDGIREITPDKKLSTWERFPIWYPIEDTFINLAERGERDSIFSKINRKIYHKSQAIKKQTARTQIAKYLDNVRGLFTEVAKSLFEDEDDETPRAGYKELFKFVFNKTENETERIFRTETTRYFNDARVDYFQENTDVDFMRIVAVTDGRISKICEDRANYVLPLAFANDKRFKPPFHPNCRSVLSPLNTDLASARAIVEKNLGAEFGKVKSETSDHTFVGRRSTPPALPSGWA